MSSELYTATVMRIRSLVYQLEQRSPSMVRLLENDFEIASRFLFFFFSFPFTERLRGILAIPKGISWLCATG